MGSWHNDRKPGQTFIVKHKKNYKGVKMQQADGAIDAFKNFFDEQKFDSIIELGTMYGPLALFFGEYTDSKVFTFDRKNWMTDDIKQKLRNLNVSIYVQNVFKSDTVKELIIDGGRVLLLCDNGDKIKEVEMYRPYLKPNDVIMAHDYFPNTSKYHSQQTWKSCEIMDKHIDDGTLDPYYAEEFEKVFWSVRIKRGQV